MTAINSNYFNLSSTSIKRIENCGTVVQILVPTSTALYSLWKRDYAGFAYVGLAFAVNQLVILSAKRLIPREGPNGHSLSFPSGHTMATAFGAVSLIKRYGIKNLPAALVVASCASVPLVGVTRVTARAHWISDVIAGILGGALISWWLVPRLN